MNDYGSAEYNSLKVSDFNFMPSYEIRMFNYEPVNFKVIEDAIGVPIFGGRTEYSDRNIYVDFELLKKFIEFKFLIEHRSGD